MSIDNRKRRKVNSWRLDIRKPLDNRLHQWVVRIPNKKFAPTMKNALELWRSLSTSDISVLCKSFEGIVSKIKDYAYDSGHSDGAYTGYFTGYKDAISEGYASGYEAATKDLGQQIEQLGKLLQDSIAAQSPNGYNYNKVVIDDLPDALLSTESIGPSEARLNFMSGMGNLFADDEDDFWD
jgi:hypothetical protein